MTWEEGRVSSVREYLRQLWYALKGEALIESSADELEWNTVLQVFCRTHPDGADCMDRFQEWYEENRKGWLTMPRAAGAWLGQEMKRLKDSL